MAIAYGDRDRIVEVLLQLSDVVDLLTEKLAELERKVTLLTKDSSNSSNPPSLDGPVSKPESDGQEIQVSQARRSSRTKGTNRDLVPMEKVDLIEEVLPDRVRFVTNLFTPAWKQAICSAIIFTVK